MSPARALEGLLRRDRAVTVAGLVVLCALAWTYLVLGAGMGAGAGEMTRLALFPHKAAQAAGSMTAMPGMDMGSAKPREGDPGLWILTAAMWWTMMIAMMAPSATPAVLLYARVHRHAVAGAQAEGLAPTGAFVAGYLAAWLLFSLYATGTQWALQGTGLLSMQGSQSKWLSAAVLLAAGIYQFTPWQNACLGHCRSPAEFLSRHWRPGVWGAVRLGALHGVYCVGCCWALMALLFVGGVMNLAWIAALTLLVMAEKLLPGGRLVARASGLVLIAWAAATMLV
jgi:predicted metal-binding membrane protein